MMGFECVSTRAPTVCASGRSSPRVVLGARSMLVISSQSIFARQKEPECQVRGRSLRRHRVPGARLRSRSWARRHALLWSHCLGPTSADTARNRRRLTCTEQTVARSTYYACRSSHQAQHVRCWGVYATIRCVAPSTRILRASTRHFQHSAEGNLARAVRSQA